MRNSAGNILFLSWLDFLELNYRNSFYKCDVNYLVLGRQCSVEFKVRNHKTKLIFLSRFDRIIHDTVVAVSNKVQ